MLSGFPQQEDLKRKWSKVSQRQCQCQCQCHFQNLQRNKTDHLHSNKMNIAIVYTVLLISHLLQVRTKTKVLNKYKSQTDKAVELHTRIWSCIHSNQAHRCRSIQEIQNKLPQKHSFSLTLNQEASIILSFPCHDREKSDIVPFLSEYHNCLHGIMTLSNPPL